MYHDNRSPFCTNKPALPNHIAMPAKRFLLPLAILPALAPLLSAAQITAEKSEHGATVKIDGSPFTEYVIRSGSKPILWPIIGPTGKRMTRNYPMEKGSKEATDHIHHRSLWFAHDDVNGIQFWSETNKAKAGAVVHRKFVKIESGEQARIVTDNDWLGPGGKKVCEDVRELTFGVRGDARWIDFDITLRASEGPVVFGDTKEGTFGIRVAEPLRVDARKGGKIINSVGQTNGKAWGKSADWVDYHGPIDGETVGIAVFDHPSSFRHPTGWHVRTYGLFAANPFARKDFGGGTDEAAPFTLPQGKEIVLRYRVFLHRGDEKAGQVAEAYAEYAKLAK
jgi:hypothetical protein